MFENYAIDRLSLRHGRFDDGVLEFFSNGVSGGGALHKLRAPQAKVDYSSGPWHVAIRDGTSAANEMAVTILAPAEARYPTPEGYAYWAAAAPPRAPGS